MIWDLKGTPTQNKIINYCLSRPSFPWDRLAPKLMSEKGKTAIPVEWEDLSNYGKNSAEATASQDHSNHSHDHSGGIHTLEYRSRVLGLAWYSGKVTLDISLEANPELAGEVFLSEGAHMIDFFYMTPEQREDIFHAFHSGDETPHDHGWFEETGNNDYWSWVGESFMGGFVRAFSNYQVTLDSFTHASTPEIAQKIRNILLTDWLFQSSKSSVLFHDKHAKIKHYKEFPTREAARAAGLQPCRTCKP